MLLINIIKKRCERVICTIFKKKCVTYGDLISGIFHLLFTFCVLCVIWFCVCVVTIGAISALFPITMEPINDFLNSLSGAGVIVFGILFGGIIWASVLLIDKLIHIPLSKTIKAIRTTIKNISQTKLAEDLKRKP